MHLRNLIIAKHLATSVLAVVVFMVLALNFFYISRLGIVNSLAERSISLAANFSVGVGALSPSSGLLGFSGSILAESAKVKVYDTSYQLGNAFTSWLADWADAMSQYAVDLYGGFISSWGKFLGLSGENDSDKLSGSNQDIDVLKEQIKQEVYDQLKKEMLNRPGFLGVSVFPSTGVTSTDLSREKNIQRIFSDNVNVKVSPDGKTGTVKPVFRDSSGGNYIFLLNPSVQK